VSHHGRGNTAGEKLAQRLRDEHIFLKHVGDTVASQRSATCISEYRFVDGVGGWQFGKEPPPPFRATAGKDVPCDLGRRGGPVLGAQGFTPANYLRAGVCSR
jgi:hypothetical protein